MAQTEPEVFWEEVDTKDPNEYAIAVFVNRALIRGVMSTFPVGTTLKSTVNIPWLAPATATALKYGDYVFMRRATHDKKYVVYYFGAPKTAEQMDTVPFRTTTYFDKHEWDTVLLLLGFRPDDGFPVSTTGGKGQVVTAKRTQVVQDYVEGGEFGTQFILEEFQSPVPFTIAAHKVPVPGSVSYDYHDVSGVFPKCLHGEIEIPALRSGNIEFLATVGSSPGHGGTDKVVIPQTGNFPTWRKYILKDWPVQLECGLWYRPRMSVKPPPLPPPIQR